LVSVTDKVTGSTNAVERLFEFQWKVSASEVVPATVFTSIRWVVSQE
jgi:hypothetical protein